ncbi:MAG TPA: primosomal protein N', partial [Candidatus Dormibacteraeota bacterium]|nr:primosomal protein N' [Candidatus Dormibacteraeota bacterium]
AAEDTFASLVQVAGRARRSDARAIVQTMNPHHYAVRLALQHDYHEFVSEELAVREALDFPPFARLIDVTASAAEDVTARRMAESYAGMLRDTVVMQGIEGVTVLGPSQAFIHRLRGEYRWSLTIRGTDLAAVKPLLPDGRGFLVDVDPL